MLVAGQTLYYNVSVLAGTGISGFRDGPGNQAQFRWTTGLAVDSTGNVFVADANNHRIRMITPGGEVSTYAGSGEIGAKNGTGAEASFNYPYSIAFDSSGNLYVSEDGGNRIRKITQMRHVTTLAGNGTAGFANGVGTAATFDHPRGITVDSSNKVYVADYHNNVIRMIESNGKVSTFAGTGAFGANNVKANLATFIYPRGIVAHPSGVISISDTQGHKMRRVAKDKTVTTLAGEGTFGFKDDVGKNAKFHYPEEIALDKFGNLYAADSSNQRIRKITSNGVVTTIAGNGAKGSANGNGSSATFLYPYGVAVDSKGNIYVSDQNHMIRKLTPLCTGAYSYDSTSGKCTRTN